MDLFEAMRTTRAMRRLDNDRPVSDADIWTIVEMATKAATGGNAQPVRWIVVTDADKRRQLGEIYGECWAEVGAMYRQRTDPDDTRTRRMLNSADHLGQHMGEAPVIIIPASKGGDPASVYPGVQNLFLAARSLGLGTTLTTVHKLREDAVRGGPRHPCRRRDVGDDPRRSPHRSLGRASPSRGGDDLLERLADHQGALRCGPPSPHDPAFGGRVGRGAGDEFRTRRTSEPVTSSTHEEVPTWQARPEPNE